jgi:hypothetical protein
LNPHKTSEQLKDHTLLMVRAPYTVEGEDKEQPARLVARVRVTPFRLDAGPLAVMVRKLTDWYGKTVVVVVANDRGDVIERLLTEGVHLYSRESFEIQKHGRAERFKFGWESDDFTRSLWVGALADKIREDAIVVESITTVMQLYQLNARDPSASREAEALGVALQLINHATTCVRPTRSIKSNAAETSMYS